MTNREQIKKYINKNQKEFIDVLFTLLKQPSISSQNIGIKECADLLQGIMKKAGIENVKIMESNDHPFVYGDLMSPENEFTLLIYGHYDVQPPEPLDKWISPPFKPIIRNNKIYARGVGDNKGQLLAHILAVKTLLDLQGSIPINLKFIFDGEEENGSPNLKPFMVKHKEMLQADLIYRSDGPLDSSGAPIINLGGRGMVSLELTATGADRDHHSGNKGNIVPNPAWKLIDLLSALRTPDGTVQVEGFYDDVRALSERDLEIIRSNYFDADEKAKTYGLKHLDMDGETYFKNKSVVPTFNINGIASGYMGEGHKTIIPSTATVRLDVRLVADQDPRDIFNKIKNHIQKIAPDIKVSGEGSFPPSRIPTDLPVVQAVIKSIEKTYEQKALIFLAAGSSGPNNIFTDVLNKPSISVPYANADEDNHAPNENMNVDLFFKGIEASCNVMNDLADDEPSS